MADRITLTKLHGLGNDFLVLFAEDNPVPPDAMSGLAQRVCDRHRGVGADGLLTATPGSDPGTWSMTLHNADGSRAEMSGNGIRCFAQAVIRRGNLGNDSSLQIRTDAGDRTVTVTADPDGDPDRILATVGMGRPGPGPELPEHGRPDARPIVRTATWDLGNPHLVLEVAEVTAVDVAREGPTWEALFAEGINVHFVAVTGADRVAQATWERGAGVTQACGTGATAVALSVHDWGATSRSVTVDMPGGSVRVGLDGEPTLCGPSEWIADLQVRQ